MSFYRLSSTLILLLISAGMAFSQIPKGLFRLPMDTVEGVAGTFGEIRSGHFHSGIDLKTGGKEGRPVYAAAAGYISRMKYSTAGFGRVLYINHPEGFTTVYGHLHLFAPKLQHLMDSLQNEAKNYEVEWIPDPELIPVQKGELIGWSGNTGGSEGPHLHFEIRDLKTEEPLNPLLAELNIPDTVKPEILGLSIYSFSNNRWQFNMSLNQIANTDAVIHISADSIGIAIETTDRDSDATNGPYQWVVKRGDSVIFSATMNRFNFNESKYANARQDTELKWKTGKNVLRCFTLIGDSCSLFKNSGRGCVALNDSVQLSITVIDFNSNSATAKLIVVKDKTTKSQKLENSIVPWDKYWQYRSKDMNLDFIAGSLYQNQPQDFSLFKIRNQIIYQIFNPGIQFHKPVLMSVKLQDRQLHDSLPMVIASVDENRKVGATYVGKRNGEWISAKVKSSGYYTVLVDSTAPKAGTILLAEDSLTNEQILKWPVSDDLSGVSEATVTLNGKWLLSWYDPRDKMVYIPLNKEQLSAGKLELQMDVYDAVGNTAHFSQNW